MHVIYNLQYWICVTSSCCSSADREEAGVPLGAPAAQEEGRRRGGPGQSRGGGAGVLFPVVVSSQRVPNISIIMTDKARVLLVGARFLRADAFIFSQ